MSFIAVPTLGPAAGPTAAISLPNMVSFCVQDSGAGGQLYLNGLGVLNAVVAGAVDLKTFFGTFFNSTALLSAFKTLTGALISQPAGQLVPALEITVVPVGSVGLAAMPAVSYVSGIGSGPSQAPYVAIAGPGVAGTWRVNIRLRHSITN